MISTAAQLDLHSSHEDSLADKAILEFLSTQPTLPPIGRRIASIHADNTVSVSKCLSLGDKYLIEHTQLDMSSHSPIYSLDVTNRHLPIAVGSGCISTQSVESNFDERVQRNSTLPAPKSKSFREIIDLVDDHQHRHQFFAKWAASYCIEGLASITWQLLLDNVDTVIFAGTVPEAIGQIKCFGSTPASQLVRNKIAQYFAPNGFEWNGISFENAKTSDQRRRVRFSKQLIASGERSFFALPSTVC